MPNAALPGQAGTPAGTLAAAARAGPCGPTGLPREGCRLSRDIASAMFDVSVAELVRANRSVADICHARHVAMYLAHVVFQVPLSSIAADFGRDRTSVAYAIRRVEDRRDERAFDAELMRLERLAGVCRSLMPGAPEMAGARGGN